NWCGLAFNAGGGGSTLDYVSVLYAGGFGAHAAITDDGGALTLNFSTLSKSGDAGLRISNASPHLDGDSFLNNSGSAVSMDLNSTPAFGSVVQNTGNGVNGLS